MWTYVAQPKPIWTRKGKHSLLIYLRINLNAHQEIRTKRKKNDYGSGGVLIMIRKDRGKIRAVKEKGGEGILWVEVEGVGEKMHIATVYLVSVKSTRYRQNIELRRELEENIIKFKREGIVMVMGDLNSRIGEEKGVRENMDKKVNENDREWIELTKKTSMITLNG